MFVVFLVGGIAQVPEGYYPRPAPTMEICLERVDVQIEYLKGQTHPFIVDCMYAENSADARRKAIAKYQALED